MERSLVTNAGLKHLAKLKQLRVLNLGSNGMRTLLKLKNLRSLSLRSTSVAKSAKASFKKRHPHCYVY